MSPSSPSLTKVSAARIVLSLQVMHIRAAIMRSTDSHSPRGLGEATVSAEAVGGPRARLAECFMFPFKLAPSGLIGRSSRVK